jgi:hypothetical protein
MKQSLFMFVAGTLGLVSGYFYFSFAGLNVLALLALLALVMSLALGAAEPRWPWLWAVLFSGSICVMGAGFWWDDMPVPAIRIVSAPTAGLVLTLLGAYVGAKLRCMGGRAVSVPEKRLKSFEDAASVPPKAGRLAG